jgi:Uma2 family endonuclease
MAAIIAPEAPKRVGLTYEEWRNTPVTSERKEVVKGELTNLAAPTPTHQWLLLRLARILDDYAQSDRRGIVLPAPVDVVIQREPRLQVRQPDIVYWRLARTGFNSAQTFLKSSMEIAPDLAVEFLSPDEPRRTLSGKLTDYASIAIPEVWLVAADSKSVEVLRLAGDGYARDGLFQSGDTVQSIVLGRLDLRVDQIFEE